MMAGSGDTEDKWGETLGGTASSPGGVAVRRYEVHLEINGKQLLHKPRCRWLLRRLTSRTANR